MAFLHITKIINIHVDMHDFASQIISAATEADMIKQPTQPEEKRTKSQVHVFVTFVTPLKRTVSN